MKLQIGRESQRAPLIPHNKSIFINIVTVKILIFDDDSSYFKLTDDTVLYLYQGHFQMHRVRHVRRTLQQNVHIAGRFRQIHQVHI